MRAVTAALMVVAAWTLVGCDQAPKKTEPAKVTEASQHGVDDLRGATGGRSHSGDKGYKPPTAEEMAPMRPEYLAELAKIHEPPEMSGKPFQIRKAVPLSVLKVNNVMTALGSPDKASHQQRAAAIRDFLEIAQRTDQVNGIGREMIYGVIAVTACLDGADPRAVIGYATEAMGDNGDALALRARMYLRAGDRNRSLDDLEKLMADGDRYGLAHGGADGGTDPRKESALCGWSLKDFDSLGSDPRALAAKGLYLSAFIPFGAETRGTVKESAIRDLYTRSATSWHSPIPYFLQSSIDGLGSEHSMAGAGCIRGVDPNVTSISSPACKAYDEGVLQELRELTMALVIQPQFLPALSARAEKYLTLGRSYYADGKPSRQFLELAIRDFTTALEAQGTDQNRLFCDRAMALALLGRYQEAASDYIQGMKHAENGIEESPFVYEQLANVYMKLGKFEEAEDLITQAIMNVSGGGMNSVIFDGGIRAIRTLYPEYDTLPDEILAEAVRRRYQPQFPKSWDADFISEVGHGKGKIASSILVDLFVMRGDAYMKAGRSAEALADYRRLKSDAWFGEEQYLPRHLYFNARGLRDFDMPQSWPPSPPKM